MTAAEKAFWFELRMGINSIDTVDGVCDWLEPKAYYLNAPTTRIEGHVGFLNAKIPPCMFSLEIPYAIQDMTESEWKNLSEFEIDPSCSFLDGDTLVIRLIGK